MSASLKNVKDCTVGVAGMGTGKHRQLPHSLPVGLARKNEQPPSRRPVAASINYLFCSPSPPPLQRDLSAWVASEKQSKQGEKPDVLLLRSKLKYHKELEDLDAKLFKKWVWLGAPAPRE
jgi:hypothetical protein